MSLSRMDLDMAGSPMALVSTILKKAPELKIPVPIEELCIQLDISSIDKLTTKGFEGCLITDVDRFAGAILYNAASHPYRRRFAIAHELGHFLMPKHIPDQEGRFLCSSKDMTQLEPKENDRRAGMEFEANAFAGLMLIPPPALITQLDKNRTPDIQHIPVLSRYFEVSKLAISVAYTSYREEQIAIVPLFQGKIAGVYRNRTRFKSFLSAQVGQRVPIGSLFSRRKHHISVASDIEETPSEVWLDNAFGKQLPRLYEQVYLQKDGHALLLLWLEESHEDDDFDPEADMTAAQRLAFRVGRSQFR